MLHIEWKFYHPDCCNFPRWMLFSSSCFAFFFICAIIIRQLIVRQAMLAWMAHHSSSFAISVVIFYSLYYYLFFFISIADSRASDISFACCLIWGKSFAKIFVYACATLSVRYLVSTLTSFCGNFFFYQRKEFDEKKSSRKMFNISF